MKDSGWVWQVYCFTGNQIPPSAGTVSFRRLQRNIKSFSNYWMSENNLNHAPPLVICFSSVIYGTRRLLGLISDSSRISSLFFSSQHKTDCTPAVSRALVTTVKTPRSHLWKCHIWWDAVKIFSVPAVPWQAGLLRTYMNHTRQKTR